MKKISCIMPTYNEAPRIGAILRTVAEHPQIDEVIVVDDGSKDNTCDIVKALATEFPKIRLIVHEKNTGKSGAIATGIRQATGDYIAFIDADLIGVTESDITNLVDPIVSGTADVTMSLRRNAPGLWRKIGLDYISGERIMPRGFLLPIADHFTKIPKFGLESFMNSHMIRQKMRIRIIPWHNVDSPWKYKKVGLMKGIKGEALMILDIFRTIYPWGPLYQIYKIKKLEVKDIPWNLLR